MSLFRRIFGSYWFFWILLTLPMIWIAYNRAILHKPGGHMFYWTGVFGVWLILAGLAITPLRRLTRGAGWTRWLMKRRRYVGVAAFTYSVVHTLIWMRQETVTGWLISFTVPVTLIGWIPLFIFTAMAITSNDLSVRRLGEGWNKLQRWVYLAAPLMLIHWFIAEHYRAKTMVIYSGILIAIFVARKLSNRMSLRKKHA